MNTKLTVIGLLVFSSHTCRVMLEMSEHVDDSALNETMQRFIRSRRNMSSERPLTPIGESCMYSDATCCSKVQWLVEQGLSINSCLWPL